MRRAEVVTAARRGWARRTGTRRRRWARDATASGCCAGCGGSCSATSRWRCRTIGPTGATIATPTICSRGGGKTAGRAGEAPRAGQVLLFRIGRTDVARHCGVLVAPDRFIHAQEGLGVIEANLTEGWRRRIAGRHDFPGLAD